MSSRESLELYLDTLLKRSRAMIWLRAAAVAGCIALALVLLIVWLLNRESFTHAIVIPGRIALIVACVAVAWALLRIPFRRVGVSPEAELERRLPEQQGRIQTYLDAKRDATASPLTELLARDAFTRTA